MGLQELAVLICTKKPRRNVTAPAKQSGQLARVSWLQPVPRPSVVNTTTTSRKTSSSASLITMMIRTSLILHNPKRLVNLGKVAASLKPARQLEPKNPTGWFGQLPLCSVSLSSVAPSTTFSSWEKDQKKTPFPKE